MPKAQIKTEKYQLPSTVDGICALVREILNGGHVARLELDNDDAFVRAHRWVEHDGLAEDEVTWDGALRNVQVMQEYYSDSATAFQVVVDMMLLAQSEGLRCSCWVMGIEGPELLRQWFEVDGRKLPIGEIRELLGLPVRVVKSLPPETLILCCSRYPGADPTEITLAVKTSIDLRRDHAAPADADADRSRNHPEEHAAAASPLALATRGLRRVAWRPPRPPGREQP